MCKRISRTQPSVDKIMLKCDDESAVGFVFDLFSCHVLSYVNWTSQCQINVNKVVFVSTCLWSEIIPSKGHTSFTLLHFSFTCSRIKCRRVICIKLDSECYCHHICNQTLTFPSSPETNLWKRVAECDGTQSVSHGNRSTKSEILVSFSAPCWLNRKFSHLVSAKCVHMLRERLFSEMIWSFPC